MPITKNEVVNDSSGGSAESLSGGVKSAERVLDLLELLATVDAPLGVTEIGRRLGHPKSSTSMLLATLESRGYVTADAGRRFTLNPAYRGAEPSWVGGRVAHLLRIAVPLMQRLVDTVGESSMLGMLTPDCRVQYIAKVISANELRFDPDLSALRPATLTSGGLVLLAFQRHEVIRKYVLSMPQPDTGADKPLTPVELLELLARIREDGCAVNDSLLKEGASGVAAPVFAPDGEIMAAVNLVAPTVRFNRNREQLREQLLATTAAMSRLLKPAEKLKIRGST